ncbi:MAG: PAS domain-containing protein [Dongiaceae bacterium]
MLNFHTPPAERPLVEPMSAQAPLATNVMERQAGREYWRRWTKPTFLMRCAPLLAEVYGYWDAKRGHRRMPSRADIDPAELRPYIANLLLVDVRHEPFKLTYRLVGTREVKARGGDPTGKDVAGHFIGDSWDAMHFKYRYAVEQRGFIYDEDPAPTSTSRVHELASLFLPLSPDDDTVNMVMVCTEYVGP